MDTPDGVSPGPKTPPQTEPLREQPESWIEGPDIVTALRVFDGEREFQLPRKATFTLGASRSCDISIPERGLSALHGAFVRKGARIRMIDQHSTNGLFFNGRRVDTIDLYPGDTFTAAPLTFIALNDEMSKQRPVITEVVGTFTPSPDRILVDAVKSSHPLLFTGEAGCDLDRLARAIHAVSLRRALPLVQIAEPPSDRSAQLEVLRRAARSTLVMDLSTLETPLDPTFCTMAFAPEHHIRVIVISPTVTLARKLLAIDAMDRLQHIWVRPLGMRPGDIPYLLDQVLAERGATFRLADLTPQNHDALCHQEWRENFHGLRFVSDRLIAISRVHGWEAMNWQERSAAVKVPKTTLFQWFSALGLTSPLFLPRRGQNGDRDDDGDSD
jgi:hypothetical protein